MMISKNFREELAKVEWVKQYIAIVNGEEIKETEKYFLELNLKEKYWDKYIKSTGGMPREMDLIDYEKNFYSQFNIIPVFENGFLLNISFDSDDNNICYVINADGKIITKRMDKIKFLELDEYIDDTFDDLWWMSADLIKTDKFLDFIKLVTIISTNDLIKENIESIARSFKNGVIEDLFKEIEDVFDFAKEGINESSTSNRANGND